MVQLLWKTVWGYLRKLNLELPYDPAILLLGIYPEKTTTHKDTCTLMFIAALFTRAKTWKQPKCLSTEEWIKMWYIYTMEYYSAIKRKEIPAFLATCLHLEIIMLSQPCNETPTPNAFTDMWKLKKGQTELLCRTDADSQTLKNLRSPEETVWGVGGCAWVMGWKSCEIGLI